MPKISPAGAEAYAGCCYCTMTGEHSKILSKMVYLGHRSFLPAGDPLRHVKAGFPNNHKPRKAPSIKNQEYIDKSNEKYENAKSSRQRKAIARRTGCKGSYALRKLPNHDRYLNTPVEPMHLIKDIVEHVVRFLAGLEDSSKVRNEEQKRGRFHSSWVKEGDTVLPPAPFSLQPIEIVKTAERACSVQVPVTFEWRPKPIFVKKRGGMTSHAWKELVSTYILKYTLRGLLGKRQRKTLFFFLDVLSSLCAEVIDLTTIDDLEYDVHKALSLMERDFPVSVHVVVFHLLHHLPAYLRQFGPVYVQWMYPFERFNSWIIRRVLNRRYPESTVIETYRLFEWAHFLEISRQLPFKAILHPFEPEEPKNHSIHVMLTDAELEKLKQCYQKLMPSYKQLCKRYEQERRRAQMQHRLRCFPTMSCWAPESGAHLTTEEENMCMISKEALQLNRFVRHDAFGRKVVFTTISSDTAIAKSSYVYTRKEDNSCLFGRIKFIFSHTFCLSVATTFAFVTWYSLPQKDSDSGILFVNLEINTSLNPFIPMSNLCNPIVTAVEGNHLWILSVL